MREPYRRPQPVWTRDQGSVRERLHSASSSATDVEELSWYPFLSNSIDDVAPQRIFPATRFLQGEFKWLQSDSIGRNLKLSSMSYASKSANWSPSWKPQSEEKRKRCARN